MRILLVFTAILWATQGMAEAMVDSTAQDLALLDRAALQDKAAKDAEKAQQIDMPLCIAFMLMAAKAPVMIGPAMIQCQAAADDDNSSNGNKASIGALITN